MIDLIKRIKLFFGICPCGGLIKLIAYKKYECPDCLIIYKAK